ncbi:hypothetical protein PsorP6_000071 [Peronosclerospora sorghi]|uniref:Uncharacterized protein n=1 Tax=Peronosclerospora sorghi TaxID=230839 RepID=A0ACC0WT24_9STRA|nr:hypothetical protein PsorP6_000071 [Peronosclerospora sorghi]
MVPGIEERDHFPIGKATGEASAGDERVAQSSAASRKAHQRLETSVEDVISEQWMTMEAQKLSTANVDNHKCKKAKISELIDSSLAFVIYSSSLSSAFSLIMPAKSDDRINRTHFLLRLVHFFRIDTIVTN